MNDYIYKERRLSKTEEMFHTVFSSKAVLAIVILSCIVCVSNIVFAVLCGFMTEDFTLDNLDKYIALIPDTEDPYQALENIYTAVVGLIYVFIVLAGVYFWIALGTVFVYSRAKRLESQKSVRTGFTILQAFGITKLIAGGLQTLLFVFVGFALLRDIETFIAGIIILVTIAVDMIYTISIVAFCSSVKKTADGIEASSLGAGTLQFGSLITGIVQGIAAVLLMIFMLAPLRVTEDISAENIALIQDIRLYMIVLTAVWIMAVVIHFLVFAVARHYAVKLPLAANSDRVYRNNMENLYPGQMYETYSSPQMPNENNQGYVPFQPSENYQGYVPYDSRNDVDDHSMVDDTPYPPYDPTKKY